MHTCIPKITKYNVPINTAHTLPFAKKMQDLNIHDLSYASLNNKLSKIVF